MGPMQCQSGLFGLTQAVQIESDQIHVKNQKLTQHIKLECNLCIQRNILQEVLLKEVHLVNADLTNVDEGLKLVDYKSTWVGLDLDLGDAKQSEQLLSCYSESDSEPNADIIAVQHKSQVKMTKPSCSFDVKSIVQNNV